MPGKSVILYVTLKKLLEIRADCSRTHLRTRLISLGREDRSLHRRSVEGQISDRGTDLGVAQRDAGRDQVVVQRAINFLSIGFAQRMDAGVSVHPGRPIGSFQAPPGTAPVQRAVPASRTPFCAPKKRRGGGERGAALPEIVLQCTRGRLMEGKGKAGSFSLGDSSAYLHPLEHLPLPEISDPQPQQFLAAQACFQTDEKKGAVATGVTTPESVADPGNFLVGERSAAAHLP